MISDCCFIKSHCDPLCINYINDIGYPYPKYPNKIPYLGFKTEKSHVSYLKNHSISEVPAPKGETFHFDGCREDAGCGRALASSTRICAEHEITSLRIENRYIYIYNDNDIDNNNHNHNDSNDHHNNNHNHNNNKYICVCKLDNQ